MIDTVTLPERLAIEASFSQAEINACNTGDGCTPPHDVATFITLAKYRKPKVILEIGTFLGTTTLQLAKAFPHTLIHTLDLPREKAVQDQLISQQPIDDHHIIAKGNALGVGSAFIGSPHAIHIRQHYGDSASFDFTKLERYDEINFCIIDGSHTFDYCKQDTLTCLYACRHKNATICWHDAGFPNVKRVLHQLSKSIDYNVHFVQDTNVAYLTLPVNKYSR